MSEYSARSAAMTSSSQPDDAQIDIELHVWARARADIDQHGLANERTADRRTQYPALVDAVTALLELTGGWIYPGDPADLDDRPMTAALDAAGAEVRAVLHRHLIQEAHPR